MNVVITSCEKQYLYGHCHSVCYVVISSRFPRTKSNYLIWNAFNLEISRKYRRGECLTWRFCSGLLSSSYNLPVCVTFIPFQVFLVTYYPHYSRGEEVVERTQRELCVAFLSAFAKLRRGAFSFFMPVSQSISPPTAYLLLDDFALNLIIKYFSIICREIQASLKSDKNNGYFTWIPTYFFD